MGGGAREGLASATHPTLPSSSPKIVSRSDDATDAVSIADKGDDDDRTERWWIGDMYRPALADDTDDDGCGGAALPLEGADARARAAGGTDTSKRCCVSSRTARPMNRTHSASRNGRYLRVGRASQRNTQ